VDARFQQQLRRVDVVHRIDLEVLAPALAHARLRRQVEHVRDPVEQRRQIRRLDLRLGEAEALAQPVLFEVAFLDRARVVIGEAVDAHHRRAVVEERRGQVRSDEAGGAGDERLHANTSRTRSGRRHGRPLGSSAACTVRPEAATAWSAFRITSYWNSIRTGDNIRPSVLTSISSSYFAGLRYSQWASITGSEIPASSISRQVQPSERSRSARATSNQTR